jgi:hypothetical protein
MPAKNIKGGAVREILKDCRFGIQILVLLVWLQLHFHMYAKCFVSSNVSFARVHVCLVDYRFATGNATMSYDICQKICRLYAHENAGLTVSVKLAVGFHSTE